MGAKTQCQIADDWLRSMTIFAHSGARPVSELLAEIAAVNDTGTHMISLVSPLLPGEARDLRENICAHNRPCGREAMVHAMITQVLLGWCATAARQTRSEVIERLALTLDTWLDQSGLPEQRG